MNKAILLDGYPFDFHTWLLPCLVTGASRSGASYFSVSLIAKLIKQWLKVIFFSAYPMARDELLQQIWPGFCYEVVDAEDIVSMPRDRSILIQSGNFPLWEYVMDQIHHLNDYIVFVKNFEKYDITLLASLTQQVFFILSGNIDDCTFKTTLASMSWWSLIVFTPPLINLSITIDILGPYQGYLHSETQKGIIQLKEQ